eukprot:scaffold1307_cov200-Pinguiococcus_pyrenoidosus.AAC.41
MTASKYASESGAHSAAIGVVDTIFARASSDEASFGTALDGWPLTDRSPDAGQAGPQMGTEALEIRLRFSLVDCLKPHVRFRVRRHVG